MKKNRKGEIRVEKFKKWITAAGIRALRTVAQTAAALIGTSIMISEVNWRTVCSASLLSGLVSLLTSIGGLPEIELKEQLELEHNANQ